MHVANQRKFYDLRLDGWFLLIRELILRLDSFQLNYSIDQKIREHIKLQVKLEFYSRTDGFKKKIQN